MQNNKDIFAREIARLAGPIMQSSNCVYICNYNSIMHLPDLCANGAAVMVTAHTATSIINTVGVAISKVLILKLVLH